MYTVRFQCSGNFLENLFGMKNVLQNVLSNVQIHARMASRFDSTLVIQMPRRNIG